MKKEEFVKMFEKCDIEKVLNQFYHEHKELRYLWEMIKNVYEDVVYIEHNLEKYEEVGMPTGRDDHFQDAYQHVEKLKNTLFNLIIGE